MIDVSDIVADADLQAPQPFMILRSINAQFINGGFVPNNTELIQAYGPVQRAASKDVEMLPEADRVHAVMAFWWTRPIYVTTGKARLASTHDETPAGAVPGTVYTLSSSPPGESFNLYRNGLRQQLGIDYTIVGSTITLTFATVSGDVLYVTWPIVLAVGNAAADIIQYPANNDSSQYRVLDVKHYPGSGYWKALGTRMSGM